MVGGGDVIRRRKITQSTLQGTAGVMDKKDRGWCISKYRPDTVQQLAMCSFVYPCFGARMCVLQGCHLHHISRKIHRGRSQSPNPCVGKIDRYDCGVISRISELPARALPIDIHHLTDSAPLLLSTQANRPRIVAVQSICALTSSY